jgi:hypothetical protein
MTGLSFSQLNIMMPIRLLNVGSPVPLVRLMLHIHSWPSSIYSVSIVISAIMSSNSSPVHLQAPVPVPNRV